MLSPVFASVKMGNVEFTLDAVDIVDFAPGIIMILLVSSMSKVFTGQGYAKLCNVACKFTPSAMDQRLSI